MVGFCNNQPHIHGQKNKTKVQGYFLEFLEILNFSTTMGGGQQGEGRHSGTIVDFWNFKREKARRTKWGNKKHWLLYCTQNGAFWLSALEICVSLSGSTRDLRNLTRSKLLTFDCWLVDLCFILYFQFEKNQGKKIKK